MGPNHNSDADTDDGSKNVWERIEERMDEGESFSDAAFEEGLSRDEARERLDPYQPDPDIENFLNETDCSCTNEELGLDKHGNREDW